VLSEVEHVCDRVGIVREGHLATVGNLDQLAGIRAHRVEIEFADEVPVERLRAIPGFEQVEVTDHGVTGMFRGSFEPLLVAIADRRVTKLTSREPSLEEIFLDFYR
jgi:ABC-2 type transport system ATP-binding protein